jgi:hypothetical protein
VDKDQKSQESLSFSTWPKRDCSSEPPENSVTPKFFVLLKKTVLTDPEFTDHFTRTLVVLAVSYLCSLPVLTEVLFAPFVGY